MANVNVYECEHCHKRVDNRYEHRGWIAIDAHGSSSSVSISRSTGRMGKSSFLTDYLQQVRDFCSVTCLVAALDKKARERDDKEIADEKTLAAERALAIDKDAVENACKGLTDASRAELCEERAIALQGLKVSDEVRAAIGSPEDLVKQGPSVAEIECEIDSRDVEEILRKPTNPVAWDEARKALDLS